MARLSQTQKEIIKTALFLIVVGVLVFVYAIYPLSRTKAAMGRQNLDDYKSDSLIVNDPSACLETGLACDTFRVEVDGLTNIACLYVEARTDSLGVPRGTVFLLHSDTTDRTAMLPWAERFVTAGYNVVLYDQRASGYSTGKYHGEGRYEATDLEEIIAWLDIRDRISHPMAIIGRTVGADAAYLAALEEPRIEGIVAINPWLTTGRMWEIKKRQHDMWSFPFFTTMMWWWYNIRSSYAAPFREIDDLEAVAVPTLVFVPAEALDSPEIETLQELSENDLLKVEETPPESELLDRAFEFVSGIGAEPVSREP